MTTPTSIAYAEMARRLHCVTLDGAYEAKPNMSVCVPIVILHVVPRVVEAEVAPSQRYARTAAKKPRMAKYGCQMVVGMDLSGQAIGIVFKGEGQFGTMATRLPNKLQPGSMYGVAPPHFGTVWRAGGIEILEVYPSEYLKPIQGDVWEIFARALRSTLPDSPHFTAAFVKNCEVQYVLANETVAYDGCGNPLCQGVTRVDQYTCPHCPTEANRKRKYYLFRLLVALDDVTQSVHEVEFAGRSALQMVAPELLDSNTAWPEFWEFNALIEEAIPTGTKLDLLVWSRGTEGEDHVLSDPHRHGILYRLSDGSAWPIVPPLPPKVQTLAELLGMPKSGIDSKSLATGRQNVRRPLILGLDNATGNICATNTLLQMMVAVPCLHTLVDFACKVPDGKLQPSHKLVFRLLGECLDHLVVKHLVPSSMSRIALHRSLETALSLSTDRRTKDNWADLRDFWRIFFCLITEAGLREMVTYISSEDETTCPLGHSVRNWDEKSSQVGIEVHAVDGGLDDALRNLGVPFSREFHCEQCNARVVGTCKRDYVIVGSLFPILVNYPPGEEGIPFVVPKQFTFARQQWKVAAVGQHFPGHWVANVGIASGQVWTANDSICTMCPDGNFPVGCNCLIFASSMTCLGTQNEDVLPRVVLEQVAPVVPDTVTVDQPLTAVQSESILVDTEAQGEL